MTPETIDRFFQALSEGIDKPMKVILTGGALALLLGGSRPTLDIDFALSSKASPDEIEKALSESIRRTRVQAQYAEDIDRWSMISFLDYKKHVRPYKKFGKIEVGLLEPEYWSIGKMARYYDSDVEDMIAVFKRQKTKAGDLVKVWEKALKASLKSDALFHFKKHRGHFLKTYGKLIWGKKFDSQQYGDG